VLWINLEFGDEETANLPACPRIDDKEAISASFTKISPLPSMGPIDALHAP
jgi:hypothetical protein